MLPLPGAVKTATAPAFRVIVPRLRVVLAEVEVTATPSVPGLKVVVVNDCVLPAEAALIAKRSAAEG
jgi:hypothetical protein